MDLRLPPLTQHPSFAVIKDSDPDLSDPPDEPTAVLDTFNRALDILTEYESSSSDSSAHVLRSFLFNLPNHGTNTLASDIVNLATNPDKLSMLSAHLVDAILKPFKVTGYNKLRAITSSTNSSATSGISFSMHSIQGSSRDQQRTLRTTALERDKYRCAFSGSYDENSVDEGLVKVDENDTVDPLQCCHILPLSLRKFNDGRAAETHNCATIWWSLRRYFPALRGLVGPESLNQICNTMSLITTVHNAFHEMKLGFSPTPTANRYEIKKFKNHKSKIEPIGDKFIEFLPGTPSAPPPHPELLRTHCIIGQILFVNGIGEKIDREMRGAEEAPDVIEPDGSTDLGKLVSCRLLITV